MDKKVIVITGASSGFGALTARKLAKSGHTVYAGIRNTTDKNQDKVADLKKFAKENDVDLRAVEMDVSSQVSVDTAIAQIEKEQTNGIDVLIHNAGHMVVGAVEAFTPEQIADLYDTNVVSTQRVNRAALPSMRAKKDGLVIWISSSSVKGGTPPYLGPYFAAKAGMDSLAVSSADELVRFGIETSIIVPGSFTKGTNHFHNSGRPEDEKVQAEYDQLYPNLMDDVSTKLAALFPADGDVSQVADEIDRIISLPKGERPFRSHVDPADDGSKKVSDLADQNRAEFMERIGLKDLLNIEK